MEVREGLVQLITSYSTVAASRVSVDCFLSLLVLFTSIDSVTALFEVPRASAIQGGIKVSAFKLPV